MDIWVCPKFASQGANKYFHMCYTSVQVLPGSTKWDVAFLGYTVNTVLFFLYILLNSIMSTWNSHDHMEFPWL